jgi:hypothetical protein
MGFGIWHFFVPRAWRWYSYIDVHATELVAAIRATNTFFSLSLVLFGIMNVLLILGGRSNRYSIIVMLAATSVLWLTRVALQIIYPQGTLYPGLQYAMLLAFVIVTLCCRIPLISILLHRLPPDAAIVRRRDTTDWKSAERLGALARGALGMRTSLVLGP